MHCSACISQHGPSMTRLNEERPNPGTTQPQQAHTPGSGSRSKHSISWGLEPVARLLHHHRNSIPTRISSQPRQLLASLRLSPSPQPPPPGDISVWRIAQTTARCWSWTLSIARASWLHPVSPNQGSHSWCADSKGESHCPPHRLPHPPSDRCHLSCRTRHLHRKCSQRKLHRTLVHGRASSMSPRTR
jgi:hypothetical protein